MRYSVFFIEAVSIDIVIMARWGLIALLFVAAILASVAAHMQLWDELEDSVEDNFDIERERQNYGKPPI